MKNKIIWLVLVCFSLQFTSVASAENLRSSSLKQSRKISKRIDQLVKAKLTELGQKHNPKIDDNVFVRRIYLDVVGRIPTLEETQAFFESKSKTKRADLIDELLDSYGHVSRQFNYWADVLRVLTRNNRVHGQTYVDFLKDSLEQNQPYDEFVRDLLNAEGEMFNPDHGAVGYYLRDMNMPEDNMSNTVRVFLGTRLECAQCHDHPYDVWTQKDYFEMVAFTGGMRFRSGGLFDKLTKSEQKELMEYRDASPEKFAEVRNMLKSINMGVFGTGTGLARLPEGFMGSDGEENEIITGKTMFEKHSLVEAEVPISKKRRKGKKQKIPGAKDLGSREAYSKWLTSPENPRFSMTIANRLWKQSMGMGLIEPVDTIDDSTEPSNEELMDYLAETMVELDFDRKAFLRAIYNSRTYQSHASPNDINDVSAYGFNGPVLRRMSAEQLWDSLIALTLPSVDKRSDESVGVADRRQSDFILAMMEDEKVTADEMIELAKLSGKEGRKLIRMEVKSQNQKAGKALKKKLKALNKQIKDAKKKGKVQLAEQLMIDRAELVTSVKSNKKFGGFKRASELRSPERPGHFLREFGQSDRQQIENSNTDPAVTQVLSMMNGFIEKSIAKDQNTVLMTNVLKAERSDVIDVIYLTMLQRPATRNEIKTWAPDFAKSPALAYADLIWMLANSNEFIFVR